MNEINHGMRRAWPAAFLLLNLAAVAAWFAWYGGAVRDLSVVSMTPSGVDVDNEKITEIRIVFNLPLNPETVRPDSVRLIPPLPGRAEPAGENAIRFLPHEPPRPATGYTVVLSPGLRGSRGEAPPRELLEFSTARFALESATQAAFDRYSYTVELEFNQPVAAAEIERVLKTRVFPGGDKELVRVRGGPNSPRQRVAIDTAGPAYVLLTLPAGMTGAEGPLGLAEERNILFHIPGGPEPGARPDWAKDMKAVELRPEVAFLGMTAESYGDRPRIEIRATARLDASKAPQYVKVSPEVPLAFSPSYGGLTVAGDFRYGRRYRVTIGKGMPSDGIGSLSEEISRDVWFDDAPPLLEFTYGGGFLSPEGALTIPVRSRNVERFNLGVRKLYESNLVEVLLREYSEGVEKEYAEPELSRDIAPGGVRNEEKETPIDLRELIGESPLGVYGLEIREENRRWHSRNVVATVSDIGLSAREGRDTFFAWATSIREGTPRPGVRLRVYSSKRQLLAEGTSGDDGTCLMPLPPRADGEKPALLLGEGRDGEFSFVRLGSDQRSREPETRAGVAYVRNYEVFLSAERGVYRGGEKVLLTGLARDEKIAVAADLPLEITLMAPDRREIRKIPVKSDRFGRISFETDLGESFPGGIYSLEARIPGQDETVGAAMFRVADYLPESLSVAMEFREPEKGGEDDRRLWIKVSRLAGGRLGGIPVKVGVTYAREDFAPEGWNGWTFGDSRANGSEERREYVAILDADDEGELEWKLPPLDFPASAGMTVTAEASETGGRVSVGVLREPVHTVPYYIGVRLAENARAGEPLDLKLAAVAPDGRAFDLDAPWSGVLHRIEYASLMRRNPRGALEYEWVRKEIREASPTGVWRNGASTARVVPAAGGRYQLAVDSPDGRGCVVEFSVDGPGSTWYNEDPERLAIRLDKRGYSVGERANASVTAPFAGLALITVETDEVLSHWIMEFRKGANDFVVSVDERMRPNAHVSATLVRPALAEAEWKPHRLGGAAVLRVDNRDRLLALDLDAPSHLVPGKDAEVAIEVTRNGEAVPDAAVTLWAVDVGVLSLTGYRTPSPWDLFYRERRVGVREADMFSRLAPELSEWRANREASPGGGAFADEFARRLSPVSAKRVRPAIIHDARLTSDERGIARATLPVPEFAGSLRLMCWAASGDSMGAAEREVEVRAPVSVSVAWPRFAAPGDRMRIPVTVLNRSKNDGRVTLECRGDDILALDGGPVEIEVGKDRAEHIEIAARALKIGTARPSVTARLLDDEFTDRAELPVRPPYLFAREAGEATIPPEGAAAFTVAGQLLPENSRVKLLIGGSPQIRLAGSMESLLEYPYGCAEQTASRLLGLAYLPDLLRLSRPDQLESGEIRRLATACSERMLSMQNANGSLRMWPGAGEGVYWVSAQALFSLTESSSAGLPIPNRLVENLSSYLSERLESRFEEDSIREDGGESAALACLGLAKADKLQRSWLLRLREIADSSEKSGRPLASAALAFLANATAIAGDREAAREIYERRRPDSAGAGVEGNAVVDAAAWLMAAMAVGHADQDLLAAKLGMSVVNGFTVWTTRENCFALAALGRYWQLKGVPPDARATLRAGGILRGFSTRSGAVLDNLRAGTRIEVENPSGGSLRAFWLAEGTPRSGGVREEDVGLKARRRIFSLDGQEITKPFELSRGEIYEVRLSVEGNADDLVLVDMLPAGLEIEDASLKGRTGVGKTGDPLVPRNVEIKDDRLLVFAPLSGYGEYRYLVRAVTGGYFSWPALDAGRMYDAGARSVGRAGELEIIGGKEAANDR